MNTIDLISFLRNFYGITHPSLSFSTLTHEDVKKLFPHIKTCKKGDINLEEIREGNIICVYDKTNRICLYYHPHLEIHEVMTQIDEVIVPLKEETVNMENLDKLSKEELLKIRRKLRILGRRKEAYFINSLIRKIKSYEPVRYREKKRKLLLKESLYD